MNTKTLTKLATAIACATIMGTRAYANTIEVGYLIDALPFGDDDRVTYVNHLLGMSVGSGTFGGQDYTKLNAASGTVSKADSLKGDGSSTTTISGWDFLFVKYDGPHGGAIVWELDGATFDIPQDGAVFGLFAGTGPNHTGLGVSGFTGYGKHTQVPDGGMTVALLGMGLLGLGALRRSLA